MLEEGWLRLRYNHPEGTKEILDVIQGLTMERTWVIPLEGRLSV